MKVFYVDYGNQELLPLNRLHPLPQHLCSLPMQAINCSLSNVEEAQVSKKAISWFQEYFPGQVATIEVVELATQFCYLVQCQVVPAHLEGLDAVTTNQVHNKDLVDVLHVMECMSVNEQVATKTAPSLEESAPSSLHHSATSKALCNVTDHSETTSCKGESGSTNPADTSSAQPGSVASTAEKQRSSQEEVPPMASATVSLLPDKVAQSASTEQDPANDQHQGADTLAEDCVKHDKEVDVPEEGSVQSGDLLEESSVDLNTSGTELSMDLPPNVPSLDENDVGRAGSQDSLLSASVEDAHMDLSSSSSNCMKDANFQAPPTLGDLNVREIPIEDNSFALIVSSIISPSLFYAHVVSVDSANLDLLQQRINHYYGAPDNSVLLGKPTLASNTSEEEEEADAVKDRQMGNGGMPLFGVGSVCAAKLLEDDCWYRGVVIGVREGEEEGTVEDVGEDEGAREEVAEKEGVREDEEEEELTAEEKGEEEEVTEDKESKERVTEKKGEMELMAEENGEGEGTSEDVEKKEGVTVERGKEEVTAEEIRQGGGTTEENGEREVAMEEMGEKEEVTEEKGEEDKTTEEKTQGEGATEEMEEKERVTEGERGRDEVEEREEISVKGTYKGTQYHIHYLDYGDAAWVSADQVKPLHKQFLSTPVQTVRLSLVGVAPAVAPPTPPPRASKTDKPEMQTVKAVKKSALKRNRSKMSCNLLPAGEEPEKDSFHGRFELRSPSDSQLKDFPLISLQTGARYASAPDVRQTLQGSYSNVSEVSEGLNRSFCSLEEEEVVMWSKEAIAMFRDLTGEQVLLAMVLEEG